MYQTKTLRCSTRLEGRTDQAGDGSEQRPRQLEQAEDGSLQESALWSVGYAEFFWHSHWHTLIIWPDILM